MQDGFEHGRFFCIEVACSPFFNDDEHVDGVLGEIEPHFGFAVER